MISAVVLLAGAGAEAPVTSVLVKYGFEVTPIVGGSLVATGDAQAFAALLGEERLRRDGETLSFVVNGERRVELSAEDLPDSLAGDVVGIEIQRPPDFGPNDF